MSYFSLPRNGLVLEYLGDGNALDTNDGTKATLTATNVSYASCPVGYQKQWASFGGSGRVTAPSSAAYDFAGTGGFEFIVFCAPTSTGDQVLIHREDGASNYGGYNFQISSGSLLIRIRSDSNVSNSLFVTYPGPANVPKMFSARYDGLNLKIFDGILEIGNQASNLSVGATASGLGIGSVFGGGAYYSGLLGAVRMFNRPLTDSERLAYFHEFNRKLGGGGKFGNINTPSSIFVLNPGKSYDAVVGTRATEFNTPTQATDDLGIQRGVTMNGTSQYMTFPSSSAITGASPRTIISKFKINTSSGTRHLVAWGSTTPYRQVFSLSLNEPNSRGVQLGTLGNDYYTAANAFTLNEVHTIIATYDGGTLSTSTIRIYIDGVKQSLTPAVSSAGAANTASSEIYIGRWIGGGNFYSGDIYFSEILSYAVTDSEAAIITKMMNDGEPYTYSRSVPIGLREKMAVWYPGIVSGTTAFDLSGNGNNGTVSGSPTVARAMQNDIINFDGVNDTVTFPNIANIYGVTVFARPTAASKTLATISAGKTISIGASYELTSTGLTSPVYWRDDAVATAGSGSKWGMYTVGFSAETSSSGSWGTSSLTGNSGDFILWKEPPTSQAVQMLHKALYRN